MSQIIAPQSLAAGATYTSPAYVYDTASTVVLTVANSATLPPVQPIIGTLQLSIDGINWINVDHRIFGMGTGITYPQGFDLSNYSGPGVGFAAGIGNPLAWLYYRFVIVGDVTNAVTIAATDSLSTTETTITLPLIAAAGQGGGACGSWLPPQGGPIIVTRVIIYVITGSTGAANMNAGIAANATTTSSTFIGATSVHTAATIIDSNSTATIAQILTGVQAITFTNSATCAGMVANAYIKFIQP